jgi:hypothetical protein
MFILLIEFFYFFFQFTGIFFRNIQKYITVNYEMALKFKENFLGFIEI